MLRRGVPHAAPSGARRASSSEMARRRTSLRVVCARACVAALLLALLQVARPCVARRRRRGGGGATAPGQEAVDAHGRTAACRACHRMVVHLDEALVPELEALQRRRAAGVGGRAWGEAEGTIEEHAEAACATVALQRDGELKRACRELLDEHQEVVVAAFSRWVARPLGSPEPNWVAALCGASGTGACPTELAELSVAAAERLDAPASTPAGGKLRLRSEEATPPGAQGGVWRLVASDVLEVVLMDVERDVVLYVAAPGPGGAPRFDEALRPRLAAAAKRLAPQASTLRFGVIDAQRNDLPPILAGIVEGASAEAGPVAPSRAALLMLRAELKHKPVSLVALRFEEDDDAAAPTLEQLLYLINKWATRAEDKDAAAAAAIEEVKRREREELR